MSLLPRLAGMLVAAAVRLGPMPSQVPAVDVFLLEDAAHRQWCAYTKKAVWQSAVQHRLAMQVRRLHYVDDRLAQIDVTTTDESGDWMVFDSYFLDDHGVMVRLSRTVNVLPGDRSISQTFAISGGKARLTKTTGKQLSTGQIVKSPEDDWAPDEPIRTSTTRFPFAALLGRPGVRTTPQSCGATGA